MLLQKIKINKWFECYVNIIVLFSIPAIHRRCQYTHPDGVRPMRATLCVRLNSELLRSKNKT